MNQTEYQWIQWKMDEIGSFLYGKYWDRKCYGCGVVTVIGDNLFIRGNRGQWICRECGDDWRGYVANAPRNHHCIDTDMTNEFLTDSSLITATKVYRNLSVERYLELQTAHQRDGFVFFKSKSENPYQ